MAKPTRSAAARARRGRESGGRASRPLPRRREDEVAKKLLKKFYEQLSKCIISGVHADSTKRTKVAELLRYQAPKTGDELISFMEYVDHMKIGQNDIFCATGERKATVATLETLRKKGYELMFMGDSIDEYEAQQLKELDGKKRKPKKDQPAMHSDKL
eukprot:TRINITY_DN4920_c0_g1_i6.p1 TRINITY_DN4920_c0_g1~~TRINITY_DN4920_c0_g1_i6.p1  ORF type:complete len:158 (+),score=54.42 TRINITY_DN4920_c0_g1_i6:62-535(+)